MNGRSINIPPPRAIRSGSFELPLEPREAFDLFTPEGERRWVSGWDPVVVSGSGATESGTVFLTDHGGEQTIWTVIEFDSHAGRLLYSRVSPGRRAGTVRVQLTPAEAGSRITVSYDLTAIGSDGEEVVRAMDETAFSAMLDEWRRLILAALA